MCEGKLGAVENSMLPQGAVSAGTMEIATARAERRQVPQTQDEWSQTQHDLQRQLCATQVVWTKLGRAPWSILAQGKRRYLCDLMQTACKHTQFPPCSTIPSLLHLSERPDSCTTGEASNTPASVHGSACTFVSISSSSRSPRSGPRLPTASWADATQLSTHHPSHPEQTALLALREAQQCSGPAPPAALPTKGSTPTLLSSPRTPTSGCDRRPRNRCSGVRHQSPWYAPAVPACEVSRRRGLAGSPAWAAADEHWRSV